MHSVEDAILEVLGRSTRVPAVRAPFGVDLLGRVLAEDMHGDRDLPPFDKAMMDGVACRASDAAVAGARLRVIGEVTAGWSFDRAIERGEAVRIATGAPLPAGADAVVMVEECSFHGGAVSLAAAVSSGQHVQPRGREIAAGSVVLAAGTRIGPAEVALLAAVGMESAAVFARPRVSVLCTGDELVPAGVSPGPSQIRNSNGPMLVAQLDVAGASPEPLGIARDDRDHLRELVRRGLEADALVLSGGVSAGRLDLVPEILREQGVEPHVHKVAMKPGKPLFFGSRGQTLVFGLPGNPVSSFVGFTLFVAPALRAMAGHPREAAEPLFLPLDEPFAIRGDRPTYHPARTVRLAVGEAICPVEWHGSPDLKGLTRADALIVFPAGDLSLAAGSPVAVLRLPA